MAVKRIGDCGALTWAALLTSLLSGDFGGALPCVVVWPDGFGATFWAISLVGSLERGHLVATTMPTRHTKDAATASIPPKALSGERRASRGDLPANES